MPRTAEELLNAWTAAKSVTAAQALLTELEPLADELKAAGALLGDLYDELAREAADENDFATAVRLQTHSMELESGDDEAVRRALLGYYQLAAGLLDVGRATFAQLLADEPDDVGARILQGMGLEELDEPAALAAFDDAIAVARRTGDAEGLADAQIERADLRDHMDLEPDADDLEGNAERDRRAAERALPTAPALLHWFRPGEHEAALEHWPALADYAVGDVERYNHQLEHALREHAESDGIRPQILPVTVVELLARDIDPTSAEPTPEEDARVDAWADEPGVLIAWPPGRNDPCWCESGRKYKRCCGAA